MTAFRDYAGKNPRAYRLQVENWRASHPPSSPSSSSTAATAPSEDSEVDGTVIVRDMVSRGTLAHFRAHTSPLLLLRSELRQICDQFSNWAHLGWPFVSCLEVCSFKNPEATPFP